MSFHRPYSPSPSDPSSENYHTILYPTASSSYRPSFALQEVTGYETIFDELPRYEAIQTPLTCAPREVSPPPYSEIAPNADVSGDAQGMQDDGPVPLWYMTDAEVVRVSREEGVQRFDRVDLPEAGPSRYAPRPVSPVGIPRGAHMPRPVLLNPSPFRAGLEAPRPRSESYVLQAREAMLKSLRIMDEDDSEEWDSDRDRYEDDSEDWDSDRDYEYDSEEDGSDGGPFGSDVGQHGSADGNDDSEEGPSRRELRM